MKKIMIILLMNFILFAQEDYSKYFKMDAYFDPKDNKTYVYEDIYLHKKTPSVDIPSMPNENNGCSGNYFFKFKGELIKEFDGNVLNRLVDPNDKRTCIVAYKNHHRKKVTSSTGTVSGISCLCGGLTCIVLKDSNLSSVSVCD